MVEDTQSRFKKWSKILSRQKADQFTENGKFAKVLGLVDLISLGTGATIGLGAYVLAGSVANLSAGPAVILSFFFAAVASIFSGLCYAEFAGRVPRAGSAYIYSYVTIGEFCAFVIGWNLILEYAIGTASIAKGLSLYLDNIFGNTISLTLIDLLPLDVSFLSPYPDFLAFGVVVLMTVLLAWGVRESSSVTNLFTMVNLVILTTVIIIGLSHADLKNWEIPKAVVLNETDNNYARAGEGGFMPFGWAGVMSGAAKCFYGYVGFDAVACTVEEAKNPRRDIPLAIVGSLFIIFLFYFGISTAITLVLPYYEQDINTPLVKVLHVMGFSYLENAICIGAISALSAGLLGTIFPLPRVIYAMAEDGLLFKFLSGVNSYTKTPLIATILSGLLTAIVSGIFDLEQLIDMMSIGTLLAYTIVTICVLLLRFKVESKQTVKLCEANANITRGFKITFNLTRARYPSYHTHFKTKLAISSYCIFVTLLCFMFNYGEKIFSESTRIYLYAIIITLMVFSYIVLARQPQNDESLGFKVPFVPLLPCLSIIINVYLMVKLNMATWFRFFIWLTIGFFIYVFYAIDNSEQGKLDKLVSQREKDDGPFKKQETETRW